MSESNDGIMEVAHMVIAQRIVLEEFMATIFASLGQTRADVEAFGENFRNAIGVNDESHPRAETVQSYVPALVSHVDRILAEVRRKMPS